MILTPAPETPTMSAHKTPPSSPSRVLLNERRLLWVPFGAATGAAIGAAIVWQGMVGDATTWWLLACASSTLAGYLGGTQR